MMPPSEEAIALFLSQTSSTRNRALLYIGITDGNVADAVALFNCKPDESFRAVLSRPAAQFRRPLANGANGYEDKHGVIHLETFTDNESEDEIEVLGALTRGQSEVSDYGENLHWTKDDRWSKIHQPKIIRTERPPLGAAKTRHCRASGTMRRSNLAGKIAVEFTKKGPKKNSRAADRDSTFEPEEIDQTSQASRGALPKLRNRSHRGKYARELGVPGFRPNGWEDDTSPISARTRTSLKQFGRFPKRNQSSRARPRNNLPPTSSPKKRATGATNPSNARTRKQNQIIPVTPTRRSARQQLSEEYEPYVTSPSTAQSRFKQAKKNTAGIPNPRTPRSGVSSNPFGMNAYPTPLSISSSRLKTDRMTSNNNPEQLSEEILQSAFHRSYFESISPLAMKSDYYHKSKIHRHQHNTSDIPLQDLYQAPSSSITIFSFRSALNLAREKKKWLLINIQSATVPACRILNREIWRHPEIADIVRQSFIFLQLNHDDERAEAYFGKYYGVLDLDEESQGIVCAGNNRKCLQLPHIALLDPVSGHRWKVWDGPGLPDKDRFLADLSEYEMVGEGEWCEWGTGVIGERV